MKIHPPPIDFSRWQNSVETPALVGGPSDPREEYLIEITNEDHSETYGYAVPEYSRQFAALPAVLKALENLVGLQYSPESAGVAQALEALTLAGYKIEP